MDRIFVDVRETDEYNEDHVEGAINLPLTHLLNTADPLQGITKGTEIVLYCASGNRADTAMHKLRHHGYKKLVNGINKEHVQQVYKVN